MLDLKTLIIDMVDSENDGIRTHVVKFLESVVLTLTRKSPESEVPKKQENVMNIVQRLVTKQVWKQKRVWNQS